MLDMANTLAGKYAVTVYVTNELEAAYRFGSGETQAEIDIDLFTLNRRASGRISADAALDTAQIRGDLMIAREFLQNCDVLY